MNFDQFENLARLYVVGALDSEELDEFAAARKEFGERAECFVNECRKLNSVFALSLRPHPPRPEIKRRLLEQIREAMQHESNGHDAFDPDAED